MTENKWIFGVISPLKVELLHPIHDWCLATPCTCYLIEMMSILYFVIFVKHVRQLKHIPRCWSPIFFCRGKEKQHRPNARSMICCAVWMRTWYGDVPRSVQPKNTPFEGIASANSLVFVTKWAKVYHLEVGQLTNSTYFRVKSPPFE